MPGLYISGPFQGWASQDDAGLKALCVSPHEEAIQSAESVSDCCTMCQIQAILVSFSC